ncbi:signal recognition particle-docking protein FtsY [Actinobacillus porcinus]|uniref:signal recognition particle-docking protein FtsY n=1 Tax=Actinobacillus porcinus TaxID=51048 RepID=UPI0023540E49|nr:signal recognition particle-docking protein FtsY [Actinobacillus porcinus]
MAEEKKKGGFWSWFGLGKKENQAAPEEKDEHLTDKIEDTVGDISEQIDQKLDEITEKLETTLDQETKEIIENFAQSEVALTSFEHQTALEPTQPEQFITPQPEIAEVPEVLTETEETLAEPESAVEISEVSVEQAREISDELSENHTETMLAEKAVTQEKPSEGGFFSRLLKGLVKTKQNIGAGFRSFFLGKKIDDELFEELEEQLLVADIGVPTTMKIIKNLEQHASRQQLKDADLLYQQLKHEMADILKPVEKPLEIDTGKKPYVILMVGVNGVGKTTTIGKLARQFQQQGKSVMLAAGDTFRAAAVEQLQVWGERNYIPVIAQSTGSDSASVIFDAMQSAAARNIDILIADTAGRLQNKNNLMDELKKIVRVMKKYDETAPHEIMLTLDAGTGQNAISQAKLFNEAVGLTGISLTKLDGTAKGGVIFAIADQFNLPIRYIGVGEKIEDLRTFKADEFIDALFSHEDE